MGGLDVKANYAHLSSTRQASCDYAKGYKKMSSLKLICKVGRKIPPKPMTCGICAGEEINISRYVGTVRASKQNMHELTSLTILKEFTIARKLEYISQLYTMWRARTLNR